MQPNPDPFAGWRKPALAGLTILLTMLFCPARAAIITKAATGTDLTAAASWNGPEPASTDLALWTTNSLCEGLTLYGYESWDGMCVADAATNIDISGWATLTLGPGGIDMSAATVNLSLAEPIFIETNQTWTVNSGTTLTVASGIGGSFGLVKSGSGTLVLSGNNPLTGVITVNQGTVVISGQIAYDEGWIQIDALTVNAGGTVCVSGGNAGSFLGECNYDAQFNTLNGGVLRFATASGTSESIDRAFTIGTGGGTIEVLNTNATLVFDYFTPEFQIPITSAANLILTGAGNGVMNKSISGEGGLVKDGPGTWTLGGANTYGGNTTVSNGTLLLTGSISGNVSVAPGAVFNGTGSIGGSLAFLPGAVPQFSTGTALTVMGALNLNGNTVHLRLPDNLAPGTYPLVTYGAAGSSGAFAGTPVIDSGSVAPGNLAQITTATGIVNLVVGPPAPHLEIVSVNGGLNPSADVGFDVIVQALDADDNPLTLATNAALALNVNAGSGALGGTVSGTIAAGGSTATISGVTYSKAESGVVLGVMNTNGTLQAGSSAAFTVNPGPAATISMTSGNHWSDVTGLTLPNPFVVTVTDANGNPVAGTNVTFAIASAPPAATGQSLSVTNGFTDANGHASTVLTLGDATGTYTVTAASGTLAGSPVTFTATAINRGWREVWSDEFDYNGLPDETKWGYESGYVRNGEAQYYTVRRIQNASVTNGMLTLTGRAENYTPPGQQITVNYTSASLITLNKESWTYGRFETRAQLPYGIGTWPAFWAMGINNPQVGWPVCGEIDILEFIGLDPGIIHGNAFWAYDVGGTTAVAAGQGVEDVTNCSDTFHVYAFEWSPQQMKFFVDDSNYYTFNLTNAGPYAVTFEKPFYILLDMALGGNYNGYQLDNSILPQSFLVDYVRVYQQVPVWTGGGDDDNWSDTNNWAISAPAAGDLAVFTGTTNLFPAMDRAYTLAGVSFDCAAASFVLGTPNGSVLTLTGGGINNSSSNLQTIDVPIALAANQAFTTTTGNLIVNGPISGNGFSLTKAGAGTLTLTATNCGISNLFISSGTLALGSNASLSTYTSLSLAAGATFDVSALGAYAMSANAPLMAGGAGANLGASAAAINAGTNGNFFLNSNSITLLYDGRDPALYLSQGTLSLAGNAFTVNTANGLPLAAGTYSIIQQAAGTILSAGIFPPATGTAIGTGQTGSISIAGASVNLVVSSLPLPVTINVPVRQPDGSILFTFVGGSSGVSYRFQATGNPLATNWTTLATLTAGTNGLPNYTDSTASNYAARYYRTVTP